MKALALFGLVVTLGLPAFAVDSNQKLQDAMWNLPDQVGGIGALAKEKTPSAVDVKVLNRTVARTRAAQFVLSVIKEKAGVVEKGELVLGELTPGKLKEVKGTELEALYAEFMDALTKASDQFAALETEIKKQIALDPAARNFSEIRKGAANLEVLIKAAHEKFQPKHK